MANCDEQIDISIGSNGMFHARNMIILQNFAKAKKILQQVIRQRKDASSPHFHLGFVYVELMCPQKALAHFKQAAIIKPKIIKYKQVETWYTKLHDFDPNVMSENDFTEAIAALLYDQIV